MALFRCGSGSANTVKGALFVYWYGTTSDTTSMLLDNISGETAAPSTYKTVLNSETLSTNNFSLTNTVGTPSTFTFTSQIECDVYVCDANNETLKSHVNAGGTITFTTQSGDLPIRWVIR